jgi:hypothetical protein
MKTGKQMPTNNWIAKLNRINRATIKAAGPRYTPGSDAAAPNLQIQSLLDSIEALALSDSYRKSLSALMLALAEAWEHPTPFLKKSFVKKKRTPEGLINLLVKLGSEKAGKSERTLALTQQNAKSIDISLRKHRESLWQRKSKIERGSDKERQVDSELHHLVNLVSAVSNIVAFVNSPGFKLVQKNRMFIRGEWGTGKTHFLCDVARIRMGAGHPTLILLAHRLQADTNPLDAICQATGLASKSTALLKHLNSLGKKSGARALIIIDGINEADRTHWRKGLVAIARSVSRYPHVGLVLSCRSPFETQMLSNYSERLFAHTVHTGFEEIEFYAQRDFFAYYGIPNPQVPLLVPEFSRPLFLKMLCLSFSGKTKTAKSRGIHAIASGQKGMTKVFEDFVGQIGKNIERDFELSAQTCWKIMKGDNVGRGSIKVGIAVTMAKTVRDFVTPEECAAIVSAWTGWSNRRDINRLIRRLVTDGLLSEDLWWENGKLQDIVRLPYQLFSDHLICRHLLETYLRGNNEQKIRRAFYANQPLGKIFSLDQSGRSYRMAGLASAIMLEFPERVKRLLPAEEREVVFYLPKKVRLLSPLVEVFLNGLLWRPQSSFTAQTDHLVSTMLEDGSKNILHQTLETLVCLASRQGHPYSADRLVGYLENLNLEDRDLIWTEFLRGVEPSAVYYRLLDWIEETSSHAMTEPAAKNLIKLCAMLLTTTHRPLRDRATKALVLLGERSPRALFRSTLEMLKFNDPYVVERVVAASYGVLMRHWVFAKPRLKDEAGEIARGLYDAMFRPSAPHATTHILIRDYALGIITLARKLNPQCLARRPLARITPRFPRSTSSIPAASRIRESDCAKAKSAIHMDFENYTVGRLVASRSPYDYKHKEYRGVLRQIKWRVLNLGYSKEKFEQIDRWIAETSFHGSRSEEGVKTDRYGKKYSWIAFFEVAGMQADKGALPHYQEEHRVSECDIDPSFPEAPPQWHPPLKPFFRRTTQNPARWISKGNEPSYNHILQLQEVDGVQGPWVVLDGFVQENAPKDHREVFTFIRGLLVDNNDLRRLRSKFYSIDYPGNHAIPDTITDPYLFAGEVPWSRIFGGYIRTKSGRARRDVREAFEGNRYKKIRKKLNALTRPEMGEFVSQQRQSAWLRQFKESLGDNGKTSDNSNVRIPEFAEFTLYEKVPGISVELPTISFSLVGYSSDEIQPSSMEYPSPAVCQSLGLRNTGRMVDLVDARGRPATLYRVFDSGSDFGRSHLLFLRKDLLKTYLEGTNQRIAWLLWGERSMHYSYLEQMRGQLQSAWEAHDHIHRKMVVGRI